YQRRITEFDRLTELPTSFRLRLAGMAIISGTTIARLFHSTDGTRRYLLRLSDGREAEAVFMPEERRDTICISCQVGCAVGCAFCMTAQLGLKRNMSAGEILSQVLIVLNDVYGPGEPPPHGTNLVFMGMGESFLNYDEVMASIRIMAETKGMSIGPRRITVSTSGIVPRIRDFAGEPIRPNLAISLSGTTDEQREAIMPINRKYPLKDLIEACRAFPLAERERLTFEYVMLAGVNDSVADAKRLVRLLHGLRAKVNLIPHNPAPELPFRASTMEQVLTFQKALVDRDLPAFIRRPRGQDISAACGQLAARHEAASSHTAGQVSG
ncbi:MAG: 23S rRNA (adenine(2503)-C(2))-methyltransferase RlmN, partial [Blastocatellia bacterium]